MSLAVFKLLGGVSEVRIHKPHSPSDIFVSGKTRTVISGQRGFKSKESSLALRADRLCLIRTQDKYFIIMDDGIIPVISFKSNQDKAVFEYFATTTAGLVAMDYIDVLNTNDISHHDMEEDEDIDL